MLAAIKQLSTPAIVFFLLIFSALISLGCWQLQRAEEKRQYIQEQQQLGRDGQLALTAETLDDLSLLKYRQVIVSGHYEAERQFLIDNQHMQGKVGYYVLTPFRLQGSERAVLINRGWLPLNPDRNILPAVPVTTEVLSVQGRINSFPSVGMQLAGAEIPTKTWPAVVQVIDPAVISQSLGFPVFAFQVELDPGEGQGFLRDWQAASIMPPEKHIAYAMQWFGMAIAFTLLFFRINLKKNSLMKTEQQKKNQRLILLIFALTFVPFFIALYLHENPAALAKHTNNGELIIPPMTTELTDFNGFDQFSQDNIKELSGHWVLMNVLPGTDCPELCRQSMYNTKQLLLMMGKDLVRIRRAALLLKNVDQQKAASWWQDDTRLLRIEATSAFANKLQQENKIKTAEGVLLLMDPLGNIMMQYAPSFDPYKVKEDLRKLLSVSQIG